MARPLRLLAFAIGALPAIAHAEESTGPSAAELPPPEPTVSRPPPPPSLGVLIGLRGGATLLAGSVGEPVGPAATFGLEGGVRFLGRYYGLLAVGGDFFSANKSSQRSVSGLLFGLRAGWLSNPDGFGLVADVGAGFRRFGIADAIGTSTSRAGLDGLAGLGLHFKVGDTFHVEAPRVDLTVGAAGGDAHALVTVGVVGFYDAELGRGRKRSN